MRKLCGLIIAGIAMVTVAGCCSTTSTDGRETLVIGYGRITEGKSDRGTYMGAPATAQASKPSVPASNTGMSSESLQAVWGKKEVE